MNNNSRVMSAENRSTHPKRTDMKCSGTDFWREILLQIQIFGSSGFQTSDSENAFLYVKVKKAKKSFLFSSFLLKAF